MQPPCPVKKEGLGLDAPPRGRYANLVPFPVNALKNFAADLHVVLVHDTKGMVDAEYQRPMFPASWARMHHKGRVFYTSMGHREDVWENATFQKLLVGGLLWSLGLVSADLKANLKDVCPRASDLPKTG